jgi:predicted nucleic acid-binding Zn ribbon protein
MNDIKNIITKVIGNIANRNPDTHDKVERIWQNLLNQQELRHTKLVGIKDGVLNVHVDSPAWLYQMRIRQAKIIESMQNEVSNIKTIRFQIGTIK